jgi:outer membrane protein assembly factor BamB
MAFLALVLGLGAVFALSSRAPSPGTVVEQMVVVPDTPLTFVADPVSSAQAPFTIATVTGSAASLALSLPGSLASSKVFEAVNALGLDPGAVQAVRNTLTSVNADGSPVSYLTVGILTDDGYSDILNVTPEGRTLWYSPPMLQLPTNPTPGSTWTSTGLTMDVAPYSITGTVIAPAELTAEGALAGRLECIDVLTSVEQAFPGEEVVSTASRTSWCPRLGSVELENLLNGVVLRLADPADVQWPSAVGPPPPQTRDAGTNLPFAIPVTVITKPPLAVPGGLVITNDAVKDIAGVTVGPVPDDGGPDGSSLTWVQHPGGTVMGMATGSERIFVTTSERSLQSFDEAGRLRWDRRLSDVAAGAPLPTESLVVAGLVDGSLRAFDAASGAPAWTVRLSDVISVSPVLAGDLVVAADAAGYVIAVDGAGAARWSHSGESVESLSALSDGSILVGQSTGNLTLLDAKGNERWTVFLPDGWVSSPGVLWGDVIVLPTSGGLRGISATDGAVLWNRDDLRRAMVNDVGLVAVVDRVVQVDATGRVTPIVELVAPDVFVPDRAFLAQLGREWVAVSQTGTITFLGVPADE